MALSHETLTERIMAAAIEIDRRLGAGFLELVYEKARIIANSSTATEAAKVNEVDHRVAKECVGRGAIFRICAIEPNECHSNSTSGKGESPTGACHCARRGRADLGPGQRSGRSDMIGGWRVAGSDRFGAGERSSGVMMSQSCTIDGTHRTDSAGSDHAKPLVFQGNSRVGGEGGFLVLVTRSSISFHRSQWPRRTPGRDVATKFGRWPARRDFDELSRAAPRTPGMGICDQRAGAEARCFARPS